MKEERKVFQGLNKSRLESNIAQFKEEIGDRYISEAILSHNPQWVIEVVFWSDSSK